MNLEEIPALITDDAQRAYFILGLSCGRIQGMIEIADAMNEHLANSKKSLEASIVTELARRLEPTDGD